MSRLKNVKKISAILLLLFLVACGENGEVRDEIARPKPVTEWVDLGRFVRATFVTINGVECIVVNEADSVAVSCDWSAR